MEEKYITIPEFAQKIGISRIAVFKKVKKGQIQAIRIGRNWAISAEYADNFWEKGFKNKENIKKNPSKTELINNLGGNVNNSVDKVDKSQKDENMESMGWD